MKRYLLILAFAFSITLSTAQEKTTDALNSTQVTEKKVEFTVMPYVNYNRNYKLMLGAVPMVMYKITKNDTISPKSLSGATGVYTTNKSYFVGIFNKFYFSEDKWRGELIAAVGDLNSQFYLEDISGANFYDYGTETTVISAGLRRKIFKGLFGGITYIYASYKTNFENNIHEQSTAVTNGLEYNGLFDNRDDVYYPTTGNYLNVEWINYSEWFGNDETANKIKTEYNRYFSMRKRDVLAARFSGKFGLGDINFEQQSVIGGTDIRGYSEGKYRGDVVMGLQGEYRYNFADKMGVVGFAGVATLYGSENESFNGELLPGAGIGFRYRAFEEVKFNIGLDAAVGKDEWGVYFRIGEAF